MSKIFDIAFKLGAELTSGFNNAFKTADSHMGKLIKSGEKLNSAGKTLSKGVTAPIVASGVAMTKFAIDQEAAFAQVSTLLDESSTDFSSYNNDIRKLSSEMGIAFEDVAEAVYSSMSAGQHQDDAVEFTKQMSKLAGGGFTEVSKAVDVTTTALNAYKLESSQAQNISDMLITTQNLGKTTVDELSASMGKVIPIAEAQGVGFDQLSATYAVLTKNGLATAEAGTGMKAMFGELGKSGSKTDKILRDQTGKSFAELSAEGKNTGEVLSILQDHAEKSGLKLSDLFGSVQAGGAALTLASNGGEEFQEFLGEMGDSAGATEKAFETMADTTADKMAVAWTTIKNVAAQFGDVLLPIFTSGVEKVGKFASKFQDIGPKMQKVILVVAGLAAAVGPVLTVLGTLMIFVGNTVTALTPLMGAIAKAGGLFKYLRIALAAFTGPVGIAIAVTALLATGFIMLYKKSETFREMIAKVGDGIKSIFGKVKELIDPAAEAFKKFFDETKNSISAFVQGEGSDIIQAFKNIGSFISLTANFVWTIVKFAFDKIAAIISFVMPAVLMIIQSVWGNIKGVISGALDVIMGLVKIFSGLFTGDFAKMWEGVKQVFSGAVAFVWNFIQLQFYGKILSGAKVFIGSFRAFFSTMWSFVKGLFARSVNGIAGGIYKAWSSIGNVTTSVFNGISAFLRAIWNGIFTSIRSIVGNLRNGIVNTFNAIRTAVTNATTMARDGVVNTWGKIKTTVSSLAKGMRDKVGGYFKDMVQYAKDLPGKMKDGIISTKNKAVEGIKSLGNSVIGKFGAVVNGLVKGINNITGKLGITATIKEWSVPQYAKGTGGHPGGAAIVGDGTGALRGQEMITLPNGKSMLSPDTPTMMHLPAGTQVLSAPDTRKMMESVPHYAKGTAGAVVNWVKDKASDVASIASNVWDYAKNPKKLLDLMPLPKMEGVGAMLNMARGAVGYIKGKAVQYVKDMFTKANPPSSSGAGADYGAGGTGPGGSRMGFGSSFVKTSNYGWRIHPITKKRKHHNGEDWAAREGTPIPNQVAGVVVRAGNEYGRGNFVQVRSGGLDRVYQHNVRNNASAGQPIARGATVAYVGQTGFATGPHLHYEVWRGGKPINPAGYQHGGEVTHPELAWIGEGKFAESIIPLNNSERSRSLWMRAGEKIGMLGNSKNARSSRGGSNPLAVNSKSFSSSRAEGGRSVHQEITFAPVYHIDGGNPKDVQRVIEESDEDLLTRIKNLNKNEGRLAF